MAGITRFTQQLLQAPTILTNAYVSAGVVTGLKQYNQLDIILLLTLGSLTSAQLKVEYSIDGTNWYQDSTITVAGGVTTVTLNVYSFTASGNYRISVPVSTQQVRISVIGTGSVAGSSAGISTVLHYV